MKCALAAYIHAGFVTQVPALLAMATLLETELVLCLAVVMTLLARFLRRLLARAGVSEKYKRQQHERQHEQSSVSFLRHISLRKVSGGLKVNRGVENTPRPTSCQLGEINAEGVG